MNACGLGSKCPYAADIEGPKEASSSLIEELAKCQ